MSSQIHILPPTKTAGGTVTSGASPAVPAGSAVTLRASRSEIVDPAAVTVLVEWSNNSASFASPVGTDTFTISTKKKSEVATFDRRATYFRVKLTSTEAAVLECWADIVVADSHGQSAERVTAESDARVAALVADKASRVYAELAAHGGAPVAGLTLDDPSAGAANAAILNAAITAAATSDAASGTIELPPGRIYIGAQVTIPVDRHIRLVGRGPSHSGGTRWGTVLYRAPGYTGDMVNAVGIGPNAGQRTFVTLENLGISGAGVDATCVRIARASEFSLENVRFSNSGGSALVLTNAWNGRVTNCLFHTSGSGTTKAAVRMDAPEGEDGCNGNFFINCQWEGNNGIGLLIDGTVNWSIVNHFANCKWEDASAATWPLVHLKRAAAISLSNCWLMKGRKLVDARATGPLVLVDGPAPDADTERRANVLTSCQLSYWGDTDHLIDQNAGALVVTNCAFTGTPAKAYVDVAATVGANDLTAEANHYEHPDLAVCDLRTSRLTNTSNGRLGAFAPSATGWVGVNQALSANNGRVSRFVPTRNMRVKGIGFNVAVAAGSNDAVDVGIYDASLARIRSSGATSGKLNATTGKKRVDITETVLTAGTTYYIALSCGAVGSTAAQVVGANFTSASLADFFGTTAGLTEGSAAASIHPLPASITPGGGSTTGFALFLHED